MEQAALDDADVTGNHAIPRSQHGQHDTSLPFGPVMQVPDQLAGPGGREEIKNVRALILLSLPLNDLFKHIAVTTIDFQSHRSDFTFHFPRFLGLSPNRLVISFQLFEKGLRIAADLSTEGTDESLVICIHRRARRADQSVEVIGLQVALVEQPQPIDLCFGAGNDVMGIVEASGRWNGNTTQAVERQKTDRLLAIPYDRDEQIAASGMDRIAEGCRKEGRSIMRLGAAGLFPCQPISLVQLVPAQDFDAVRPVHSPSGRCIRL